MWVFLVGLMLPLAATIALLGASQTGVPLLVIQFGCSMVPYGVDGALASSRIWDASGDRV
jgi:hypothetical protein